MMEEFYENKISITDTDAELVQLILVIKIKSESEELTEFEKKWLYLYFKRLSFFKSFEKQQAMCTKQEVLDFFIALLKDMALESFKYGDAIITYGTIHFKLINLSSIFKAKWATKYTWF